MLDLVISGATIVTAGGVFAGTVGIEAGRIAAVVAPGIDLTANEHIDAAGLHLFPGAIDPHVHLRIGGMSFAETCERETRSLIAGGITSALVFTEAPHRSYHDVLPDRIAAIGQSSYCDLALHPMIQSLAHADEIVSIAERFGVRSFKLYFAGGGRELYPETFAVDDGVMFAAFRAIAQIGSPALAMVHAENWEVAAMLQRSLEAAGRTDAAAWSESKPAFVEEEPVRRAAFYARQAGCPLYVVHVSSGPGARAIGELAAAGQAVTGESCPHYLAIDCHDERAVLAKYNPSVKEASDREALWAALGSGVLQCVGSDHIPLRWADKQAGGFDTIWTARGGVPGGATILPLLLRDGYHAGRLSLPQIAAISSANPARLFGLSARKGAIAPGYDADLVLVDLDRTLTFDPALLQVDFSLFTGEAWRGWPVATFIGGQRVMQDGEIVGQPGIGRYLARPLA